jgi:hypothetical protein
LKTSKASSLLKFAENQTPQFSTMSFKDWKAWVTDVRQAYLARRNAARLIKESASSSVLWPTTTSSDSKGSRRSTAAKPHWKSVVGDTLLDKVTKETWPTPAARDYKGANSQAHIENSLARGARGHMGQLPNVVASMSWPTPSVSDTEGAPKPLDDKGRRVSQTTGTIFGAKLQDTVKWATPQVTDATRDNQIRKPEDLTDAAKKGGCRNLREDVQNWATPNTMDHLPTRSEEGTQKMAQGQRKGRTRPSNLREQVDPVSNEIYKEENWPTPTQSEGDKIPNQPKPRGQIGLSNHPAVLNSYPTPQQRDYKGASTRNITLPNVIQASCQADQDKSNTSGKPQEPSVTKKLSPLWVSQIMQLMPMWCVVCELTPCDFWETDVSQQL